MKDGYIVVRTTKTEVYDESADGERPFLDFRFKVEGDYEDDLRVKKYILKVYEEQRCELIMNPEMHETESTARIEDILKSN